MYAAPCQEHISLLGKTPQWFSFSLLHAMTVLLECLTVILENLKFLKYSLGLILTRLTADLHRLHCFQCPDIH